MSKPNEFTLSSHFEGKAPIVREIYDRLIKTIKGFGPIVEEPKKTSIHIVHGSALAGVSMRKDSILLNIRTDFKINSPRIQKIDQVSAKRFHNELKLTSPNEIDDELISWLKSAYELGE